MEDHFDVGWSSLPTSPSTSEPAAPTAHISGEDVEASCVSMEIESVPSPPSDACPSAPLLRDAADDKPIGLHRCNALGAVIHSEPSFNFNTSGLLQTNGARPPSLIPGIEADARFYHESLFCWGAGDRPILRRYLDLALGNHILQKFEDMGDSGKALKYIFDKRLNPLVKPYRGNSWSADVRFAGMNDESAGLPCHIGTLKNRTFEVAELVVISSHLLWSSCVAATQRMLHSKSTIKGLLLLLTGMSDSATGKLSVPNSSEAEEAEDWKTLRYASRGNTKTNANVMQSRLRITILVKDITRNTYSALSGFYLLPLQNADSNCSENTVAMQADMYTVRGINAEDRQPFAVTMRCHTQDLCSSNLKQVNIAQLEEAEMSKKHKRQPITFLPLPCHIHRSATVQTKSWELVKDDVSGLLSMSIVQGEPQRLADLRVIVGRLLLQMLRIIRNGSLAKDAKDVTESVLEVAFPRVKRAGGRQQPAAESSSVQIERFRYCFRGDLRNTREFCFFVREGEIIEDHEIRRIIGYDAPRALLPHQLAKFPRHRWTGSGKVIREAYLFAASHGLMARSIPIWLEKEQLEMGVARYVIPLADGYLSLDEDEYNVNRACQHEQEENECSVDVKEGSKDDDGFQRRMRMNCFRWVTSSHQHHVANLSIMAIISRPMENLVNNLLYLNSVQWQDDNNYETLRGSSRKYRILEAHANTYETKFGQELLRLFCEERCWIAVAPELCTVKARALAFRIIARQAAGVFLLMYFPHKQMPYAFFSLLMNDRLVHQAVEETSACRLDDMAASLKASFPGVQLFSEDLRAILATVGEEACMATHKIECLNAYWQREAGAKSLQTQPDSFASVNATFTFHSQVAFEGSRAALMREELAPRRVGRPRKSPSLKKIPYMGKINQPKRRNPRTQSCNAWSAFLAQYLRQTQGCLDGSSAAYKKLKADEKNRLKAISRARFQRKRKIEEVGRTGGVECVDVSATSEASADTQCLQVRSKDVPCQKHSQRVSSKGGCAPSSLPERDDFAKAADMSQSNDYLSVVNGVIGKSSHEPLSLCTEAPLEREEDGLTLEARLTKVRQECRAAARAKRIQQAEHKQALAEYSKRIDREAEADGPLFPFTSGCRDFIPAGLPLIRHCEWYLPAIGMAKRVMQSAGLPGTRSTVEGAKSYREPERVDKFHAGLRARWAARSTTYRKKDQKQYKNVRPTQATSSKCRILGCCLCGRRKTVLRVFQQHLISLLRKIFKKEHGNPHKEMFETARGFLKLTWIAKGEDIDKDMSTQTNWWHIAWVNQQSWAVCVMELSPDPDMVNAAIARVYGNVALRAAVHIPTDRQYDCIEEPFALWPLRNLPHAFLHFACLDHMCYFSIYELVEDERQLSSFLPACVEVRERTPPTLLWPGLPDALNKSSKKHQSKRPSKRRYGSDASLGKSLEDCDDCEESDEDDFSEVDEPTGDPDETDNDADAWAKRLVSDAGTSGSEEEGPIGASASRDCEMSDFTDYEAEKTVEVDVGIPESVAASVASTAIAPPTSSRSSSSSAAVGPIMVPVPMDPLPVALVESDALGNQVYHLPALNGHIVLNVAASSLDAHCHQHKENRRNPCRLNRSHFPHAS